MKKIKVLNDTGMVPAYSNGALEQDIIFKIEDKKFKISIRSESYEMQSYARLYQWSATNGWNIVEEFNPARDFNIKVTTYERNYDKKAFVPIVEKLTKLANAFAE